MSVDGRRERSMDDENERTKLRCRLDRISRLPVSSAICPRTDRRFPAMDVDLLKLDRGPSINGESEIDRASLPRRKKKKKKLALDNG